MRMNDMGTIVIVIATVFSSYCLFTWFYTVFILIKRVKLSSINYVFMYLLLFVKGRQLNFLFKD